MLTISIVTHNQLKIMSNLLHNIFEKTDFHLIITINVSEDETILSNYPSDRFSIVRNQKPLGFTKNHNNAFKLCKTEYFLILNPDVKIENNLMLKFQKNIFSFTGDLGEGCLADTNGLHRGLKPKDGIRLMIAISYCSPYPNFEKRYL